MVWVDLFVASLAGIGVIEVWHIFLIEALRAAVGALHWPATAAATALLTRISGLNQTVRGLQSIVAPPLGALAVSALPMHWVMGIDLVTFAFAVVPLLVLSIPEPERAHVQKSSYFSDLSAGSRAFPAFVSCRRAQLHRPAHQDPAPAVHQGVLRQRSHGTRLG